MQLLQHCTGVSCRRAATIWAAVYSKTWRNVNLAACRGLRPTTGVYRPRAEDCSTRRQLEQSQRTTVQSRTQMNTPDPFCDSHELTQNPVLHLQIVQLPGEIRFLKCPLTQCAICLLTYLVACIFLSCAKYATGGLARSQPLLPLLLPYLCQVQTIWCPSLSPMASDHIMLRPQSPHP